MNQFIKQIMLSVGVLTLAVACNSSDFSGSGASKNNKVKSPATEGEEGNPANPGGPGGGGDKPGPGETGSTTQPKLPSEPLTIDSEDGGASLNVPLGKVEITMVVDHVTDFVISNSELYAVHHELAVPQIGSIKLYDTSGNVISTEAWTLNWGSCPTYPQYDSNCSSSKLKLKAGSQMKGVLTKLRGRGDVRAISTSPFTVRVTDCGSSDCGRYGASGGKKTGVDTYVWTME